MVATRIHPGFAVLAVVAGVTAALLILQSVSHRDAATVSAPAASAAPSPPPVASSVPPVAQMPLLGIARVIDGDTIQVHGTTIRLNGIDAPESKQTCDANGQSYACGTRATEALIAFLGARPVECTEMGRDRYQRIIAKCLVDSIDLGGWMVEQGWAVAFRKYSIEYVGAEDRAHAAKLGIWAGTFELPENWRREKAIQGMQRAMEKTHVQQ